MLSDASGSVTDTYIYDAFGTLIASTGTTSNNFLYAGEEFDPNLGLYYLRARYMNTSSGRFCTTDSYEGSVFDPASLHKYLYTHSNPIDNTDPSGKFEIAVQTQTISLLNILVNAIGIGLITIVFDKLAKRHAGRLQVQGKDLVSRFGSDTISYAWSQPSPLRAAVAIFELEHLRLQLTADQLDRRDEAFADAQRFIVNASAGGGTGPRKITFQNRFLSAKYNDARVDIEVLAGLAFVP
jgi:RHS repeat-associated protein